MDRVGDHDLAALKGLPDAIAAVWPQAVTQACIVHLHPIPKKAANKAHYTPPPRRSHRLKPS